MSLFSIGVCDTISSACLGKLILLGGKSFIEKCSIDRMLEEYDIAVAEFREQDKYDWFNVSREVTVYFNKGSKLGTRLRALFIRPAALVGAGVGRIGVCSLEGIQKLQNCDVCLHDSLLDSELLSYLPDNAEKIYVGKRCGSHSMSQMQISQSILDQVRMGKRVVRLKGGDPTIFGRIAEEIELLEEFDVPYEVTPAVSSFQCASIDSGGLLTKRGRSYGFTIMSARNSNAALPSLKHISKESLPIVFYMGTRLVKDISNELIGNGIDEETPVSIIYSAGSFESSTVRGTLSSFKNGFSAKKTMRPGVVVVGDCAKTNFKNHTGALMGARVLVTGSEFSQKDAKISIEDLGGRYISFPLLEQEEIDCKLSSVSEYDWVVLTNPKSVECLSKTLSSQNIDIRKVPSVFSTSPAVTDALKSIGIIADVVGVIEDLPKDKDVLIVGSEKSVAVWRGRLHEQNVDTAIAYNIIATKKRELPEYDLVYFSSSSAVGFFYEKYGEHALKETSVICSGEATSLALNELNVSHYKSENSFGCANALMEYTYRNFKLTLEEDSNEEN